MKLKFPWEKFQMVRACIDFADLKIWESFDNMHFFVVETPVEGPVIVAIMGAGGFEYGLSMFRGPDAFAQPHLLDDDKETAMEQINTIGFNMIDYSDMQYEEKKWLKSCDFRGRKSGPMPSALVKRPGQMTEMINKNSDVKLLLYVLKGIITAYEDGDFYPSTTGLTGSEIMCLEVSGDALQPDVEVTYKSYPGSKELLELCNSDLEFDTQEPDFDLHVVPDDDNLYGWKNVQSALIDRFIDFWHTAKHLRKKRPSLQFFGDDDWEYYLGEYDRLMVLPSYVTWAVLKYRPKKNSLTFAEELLAGDLPEAMRISLEALNNSHPSLFRIEEIDDQTGNLVFKDLLLHKTITVHDLLMSKSAQVGWIGPFWNYSLGNFNFIGTAGPIFSGINAMDILEELQENGLPAEPTEKWLSENAYIFGNLWQLFDEVADESLGFPSMVNSNGEPMEFITARFKYNSIKKVRKALDQRNDVDYDREDDTYICSEDAGDASLFEMTLVSKIYFQDNEIIAEVNSQSRFENAKGILEAIDGVGYLSRETKTIEDLLADISDKDKEELFKDEPVPQEVADAIQDKLNDYYIGWLDTPLPALDNKTPRQIVKNKKGKQKVKMLIESISNPVGNTDGPKVPKQKMLKELGLD